MHFRIRLFVADEYKPLRLIPLYLWALLTAGIGGQLAFHHYVAPTPKVTVEHFSQPPSAGVFRALAFGEHATLSKLLSFWVQAFDNQPGVSIPFRELDYDALGQWLDRAVALDEKAEYPHFLMAKVYSSVIEEGNARRYKAADWVRRQFAARPNERYEWMAYMTNLMMYEVEDSDLAFEMAKELHEKTEVDKVPSWVRQLEIYFLKGHDKFEAAADLLYARLQAGEVTEPQEFVFLTDRLEEMLKNSTRTGKISREELNRRIDVIEQLRIDFLKQHNLEAQE